MGNEGELLVALTAQRKGYGVLFPFGHDKRYDLVIDKAGKLERVQVKTVFSSEDKLVVHTRSLGKKDGKPQRKLYTSKEIDAFAIVDERTKKIYYVPIAIAENKDSVYLRFTASKNKQAKNVRYAKDFEQW